MKKSLLLILTGIFLLSANQLLAQTWNTLGTAQFTNDPKYMATAVDESTGNLYVAYVDQTDSDHLKVKYFDGSAWTDLGGTVSTAGNVLFPSIRVNPVTNEVWVAYRTDVNASSRFLMVKRYDVSTTSWETEGQDIGYSGDKVPTQKIIIRFSPAGDFHVAYKGSGVFIYVQTNRTGSWTNEAIVSGSYDAIPYGFDYPTFNQVYRMTQRSSTNPERARVILQYKSSGSWPSVYLYNDYNGALQGDSEGFAADGLDKKYLTHSPSSDIKFYDEETPLASPPNSASADGKSLQLINNPLNDSKYLLYVKTDGEVIVSAYDIYSASWTNLANLNANIGTITGNSALRAKLSIRKSDGRVFVTYQDGTSITTKYFDPTPPPNIIYVDQTATGDNDGSSWDNAFTSLHDGLESVNNGIPDTLFVAQGTYKPHATSRTESFRVLNDNVKVYGGFAGTETDISQRNIKANPTIISGDLDGNDDPNDVTYGSFARLDNSYRLISVGADNVEINGFTITGGHANGSTNAINRGAAINKFDPNVNFTLKNSIIKDNVVSTGGALSLKTDNDGDITIESCQFINNLSRAGAGFAVSVSSGNTINVKVNNSLFYKNRAADNSDGTGSSGSSFAVFLNGGTVNMEMINNTFTNNYDLGTNTSVDKGTVFLRRFQASDVLNAEIHNNIFWNNYIDETGTVNSQSIGLHNGSALTSLNFTHNNTNQTNLASKASASTITNNLDADPLFVDESQDNYALQSTSTMIDVGDNTQIPSGITTDIRGFNRTFNTTVDLGAYEYFVDNTAPTVVTQDITVSLDENGNVTVNAEDVDNGSTDDIVSTADLTFSLDQTTFTCADLGANTATLTVSDLSGNSATGTATVTVEDNLAPTVSPQDVTLYLDANGTATLNPNDVDDGSSDNCGIASYNVLNNTTFDCSNLGENTDYFQVVDNAGSTASAEFTITVMDDIAPTAIAQDITIQLDANGSAEIQAEDLDNVSTDNCSIASFSVDKTSFDCTNLGANTVTLTVTDGSGNSATATATVTVEDVTNPTVTTQDITVSLDAAGQATITPAQIDNGSSDNCAIDNLSLDVDTFDCTMLGENTITLTAADASGNTANATAIVTVVDDLDPEVLTQDIAVVLNSDGLATITAAEIDNASTDNCGIASRSLNITDFDCSNIGENTVELTIEDNNGNIASATATVTIEDNQAPTVETQNITVALDANGAANITSSQIYSSHVDNCSIASYELDVTDFTCANLGENTVTLTVTDNGGNSATTTAVVTVEDNIAPTVITQDLEFQLVDDNDEVILTGQDVDNGTSDNCDFTLSLDKPSFILTDVGENTVTLSAEDAAGNISTATAVVSILAPKEEQTITFESLPAKTYGDEAFELTATASSGLAVSYSSSDQNVATISGNTLTIVGAGTSTIIANQEGNTDYKAASEVSQTLVVNKADQEITVETIYDKDTDAVDFEVIASATSDAELTYVVLSGPATISGNLVSLTGDEGTVEIEISQAGNTNYNAVTTTISFDVVPPRAAQTITFESLPAKTFGDEAFELSASASSELAVSYSSSDENVATISGTTTTIVGAGTAIITASQAGNDDFSAAPDVSQTLVVNKADQEITIESISDKDVEAADFEVVASTTSDLELLYEVLSGPATIEDNLLSLTGETGTVEIEVSQAGNTNYNAANAFTSFEVVVDPCLNFSATATVIQNVSCNGDESGSFEVSLSSGAAPFTYSIGAESQDNGLFENMAAGNYEITVTDANGCSATTTVEITQPEAIEVTAEITDSNSINGNGSISLTVTGGTGNYTYDWSNGATTANLSDLGIGEYTVTITDEAGCSITESFSIGGVTANSEAFEINIYPNPVINQVEIVHGEKVNQIKLLNARGKILSQHKTTGNQTQLEMKALPSGLYFIQLDNGHMNRIIKQ